MDLDRLGTRSREELFVPGVVVGVVSGAWCMLKSSISAAQGISWSTQTGDRLILSALPVAPVYMGRPLFLKCVCHDHGLRFNNTILPRSDLNHEDRALFLRPTLFFNLRWLAGHPHCPALPVTPTIPGYNNAGNGHLAKKKLQIAIKKKGKEASWFPLALRCILRPPRPWSHIAGRQGIYKTGIIAAICRIKTIWALVHRMLYTDYYMLCFSSLLPGVTRYDPIANIHDCSNHPCSSLSPLSDYFTRDRAITYQMGYLSHS